MKDLYLKFTNADEMKINLIKFGFSLDEETGSLYCENVSIDFIGIISQPVKPLTEYQNIEDIEYVVQDGYHVNLRIMNIDDFDLSILDNFIVNPETPVRIWA